VISQQILLPRSEQPFGALLCTLRKRARLTQKQLGLATGYSEGQICRFEKGRKPPTIETLLGSFVPALRVQGQPETIRQLLSAAAQQRGDDQAPPAIEHDRGLIEANAILEGRGTLSPPFTPAPLIGRARELDACKRLLAQPDLRLLTITGPPGVGKTRLTASLAQALNEEGKSNVYWLSAAALDRTTLFITAVANSFGLSTDRVNTMRDVAEVIGGQRVVLFLDGLEHLMLQGIEITRTAFTDMLATAPNLKLVCTTRVPLAAPGEHVFRVLPFDKPTWSPGADLAVLAKQPALDLFVRTARMTSSQFELTADNAEDIAAICAHIDGLPLAIELAAARVKLFAPRAILKRLVSNELGNLQMLSSAAQAGEARHRSLAEALNLSSALLDEHQRDIYARFSIFQGGCDMTCACALCGASIEDFERLIDHNLIKIETQADGEPRLTMLETVRSHALEMLIQSGAETAMRDAHAHYFARRLAQDAAEPNNTRRSAWRLEHANVRSALTWLIAHDEDRAFALAIDAYHAYWFPEGYFVETRAWFERLLALNRNRNDATYGIVMRLAGIITTRQGDHAAAIELLRSSERIASQNPNSPEYFWSSFELAWAHIAHGEYVQSGPLFSRCAALADDLGDNALRGRAAAGLGSVAEHVLRDYAQANRHFQNAATLLTGTRDYEGLVTARALAALSWMWLDRLDLAKHECHLIIEYDNIANHADGYAWLLSSLSTIAYFQQDDALAISTAEEAYRLFHNRGVRLGESVQQLNLARVDIRNKRNRSAAARLRAGFKLARAVNSSFMITRLMASVGRLCIANEHYETAAISLAAAEAFLKSAPGKLIPADQREIDADIAHVRERLGGELASSLFAAAADLTFEQAIGLSIEVLIAFDESPRN
jgi:predicted ATPase/DNA-binding XRE family transcriptional regulator